MDKATRLVSEQIVENWDDQLNFLAELISCRSELLDPNGGELQAQLAVYNKFRQSGLKTDMFEVDISRIRLLPGFSPVEWGYKDRPQVVGIWESEVKTGKSLTLCGHVDVVPAGAYEGWSYDPYKAQIAGGRMYGRGAYDMKGGFAAMLYALKAIKNAGIKLKGNVYIQSVLEEECGGNGALACCDRGYVGDGCLSAEAYGEPVITGYVGTAWLRMTIFGSPGHPNAGHLTVNALDKAYYLMQKLRELEEEWNRPENRHPLYVDKQHPINFVLGKIEGGQWTSMTLDKVTVSMRLSWYPDLSISEAKQKIIAHLEAAADADSWLKEHRPQYVWPALHFEGVVVPYEDGFVQKFGEAYRRVLNCEPRYDVGTSSADTRFWPLYYGKPSLCYGPLGGNCHGYNEYVDLSSLQDCTKVIARFIMDWCGVV